MLQPTKCSLWFLYWFSLVLLLSGSLLLFLLQFSPCSSALFRLTLHHSSQQPATYPPCPGHGPGALATNAKHARLLALNPLIVATSYPDLWQQFFIRVPLARQAELLIGVDSPVSDIPEHLLQLNLWLWVTEPSRTRLPDPGSLLYCFMAAIITKPKS